MQRTIPGMTPAQARAWLALVTVSQYLPATLDQQLTEDADLINFEYGVLSILVASPDQTMRMADLGVVLQSPAPRLSKAITRLERRALVERRACPSDGRSINVRLTAEGRRTLARATGPHVALAVDTVLGGVDDEDLTTLAHLLEGILGRLNAAQAARRAGGACDRESVGARPEPWAAPGGGAGRPPV